MIKIKNRLNIFIDESGDFGFEKGSSELYVVSFTLHESADSIKEEIKYLNEKLSKLDYEGMIHLAYLVAKRGDYVHFSLEKRKSIFWAIYYFAKRVKIQIHTVIVNKNFKNKKSQLTKELRSKIKEFFEIISDYIDEFEEVVIYYDNGQEELGRILNDVLKDKNNVKYRIEFDHREKRLFQVSDMLTFIDKIVYKYNNNMQLTKSEKYFFGVKNIEGMMRQLKSKRI
ncbi:MAG: DUF3800 domain-containing protein [Clostridia bacterium]|nr:DUF3800 domain-containing protein [Clostridia bacterium]